MVVPLLELFEQRSRLRLRGMDPMSFEEQGRKTRSNRVMLLLSPQSYRNSAFIRAAERLGLEVIQAIDVPDPLAREWGIELGVEFSKPDVAVPRLVEFARSHPVAAVLSLDDSATLLASRVSAELGLPHNSPDSAVAARDKWVMRQRLYEHGVRAPRARWFGLVDDVAGVTTDVSYPCVVKPTMLSGSRGVIRANSADEFIQAFERTRKILETDGFTADRAGIVVEEYVPGTEVALEGLLTAGQLQVLALFDKPDPLEGPFFEETIYVTPSRLPGDVQREIERCTMRAASALGLREGPVHAELRVNDAGPWIIEIAGRSIGGLCSTILEFGTGQTLEELILRQAVGETIETTERAGNAVGVMMIPIPEGGILRGVNGVEDATTVPGITGIEISAKVNHRLVPLPEGSSYLGFIFAQGNTPAEVEASIREAHAKLEFKISKQIMLTQQPVNSPG
jgi:biotin carboxylase